MLARYIIRLDDACPQMHESRWARIEQLLDYHNVNPIVAVIPENKNIALMFSKGMQSFWDIVKKWELKGWSIAMHGHDHVYTTSNPGLVPYNTKSEFAGQPYEYQEQKISYAWDIFCSQGIIPKIWVAPAHTFDLNTLKALKSVTDVEIISDGIAIAPYYENEFHWIPQQLWSFKPLLFGLWTICLHPNTMSDDDFRIVEAALKKKSRRVIGFTEVKLTQRPKGPLDRLLTRYFLRKIRLTRESRL